MNTDTSFSGVQTNTRKLNTEELQHLLNNISSDEQKELTDTLRACTTEVTMTRGLPVSALILGSVYFARTRLPVQYHFGPKGWPMYAILGIGSLTVTNFLSMNMCRERVQPKIDEFWSKYQGRSKTTYASLREQHRHGDSVSQESGASAPSRSFDPYSAPVPMTSQSNDGYGSMIASGYNYDMASDQGTKPKSAPAGYSAYDYGDAPSFMSGTPSGRTSTTSAGGPEFS